MDNKILESVTFHAQGTTMKYISVAKTCTLVSYRQNYQITRRGQNTHANQEKGHNYIYNVCAITHRSRYTAINNCTYKQAARESTRILVINKNRVPEQSSANNPESMLR